MDKYVRLVDKYNELTDKISDSEVIKNQTKYKEYLKEIKELEPVVEVIKKITESEEKISESNEVIKDPSFEKELVDLAVEDKKEQEDLKKKCEEELKLLLLPKDKNDEKNIILEIRAGTGGEEAALFVADLFRMYSKFADKNKLKMETLSFNETGIKGFKEIIASITGGSVYGLLKYETGVHRVQRIPDTESMGRVHTSAVTVAVLPEVEESEVEVLDKDLKIDTFRAGGAGGQHVNTTDSAVRITHIPTNTIVSCQDERSQQKNKHKALKVLRAKIAETQREKEFNERAQDRKSQVGSGDRSERIRTYNFPQSRVTDHRINKTIYKLDQFLEGDLNEIIEPLKMKEREDLLSRNSSY